MVHRIYVEKKDNLQAAKIAEEIRELLKIKVKDVRLLIRYDAEKITKTELKAAIPCVFSEPAVDNVFFDEVEFDEEYKVFAVSRLAEQYDQRADSAAQCVQLLTQKDRPLIKCATVYAIKGASPTQLTRIKQYLINPVECEETELEKPESLANTVAHAADVKELGGFLGCNDVLLQIYHSKMGLAMGVEDLKCVQEYFKKEGRNPTEAELRVIDTYWSDHCRHTTFATEISGVTVNSDNPHINRALKTYKNLFSTLYGNRPDKYPCLMDIATIAAKKLKSDGLLDNVDESDEVNACSIKIDAVIDGKPQKYTVVFKNETSNHPTEIEPCGGAATCLGGAIRDSLSARAYALQAMRITGCGDPTEPIENTEAGKLPQRVISTGAASGFSSYGNQAGIATGLVDEIYHPGFKAKRLEAGFVVGGVKSDMIHREEPTEGDVVILLGGETGRDGCGGATGASKPHDRRTVQNGKAEVQTGNAVTERKLQRLFLNARVTQMIKKCNDLGAGGIAVAIGELAEGVKIELDKIPKKYKGLSGTELAISESQERLAVVVAEKDAEEFVALAAEENLSATPVAKVTGERRLKMYHRGKAIVDISRDFLDTNGVRQCVTVEISDNVTHYFDRPEVFDFKRCVAQILMNLNVCSKKGLAEMFDSTIGSRSIYAPFGGKYQLTPAIAMASKLTGGETDDCTVSAYGYSPELSSSSPFTGAVYAIVASIAKVVAAGADYRDVRLSLQEYFMSLWDDPKRWGVPASALLGALYAQVKLGLGAIGGKDSMSGTFEENDVPPTLISYALAPSKASKLITNVLTEKDKKLYILPIRKDRCSIPDFEYLKKLFFVLNLNIESGNVRFATVVESGGIVPAVIKSCLGNGLGFKFHGDAGFLFGEHYGDIIISAADISLIDSDLVRVLVGTTASGGFTYGADSVSIAEATSYYTGKLASVFPLTAKAEGLIPDCDYTGGKKYSDIAIKVAKPKVFIPVFPGTNGESDVARAFRLAGAEPDVLVIKNRTASDIEESVKAIIKAIDDANIIVFPGGSEGCDGAVVSGKFAATAFSNPAVAEKVMELLNNRDGLILGISNGFRTLINLGLVPYGNICPLKETSPALTRNNILRHVSTMTNIRVASNLSPWLSACKVGDVYSVPVSHVEGKIVAPYDELKIMLDGGQIATQYVNLSGNPTMESPFNPNGSAWAIEGITSPDGRVFGKMGHSERIGKDLYKNYGGNFDMKIFESGVKYFK